LAYAFLFFCFLARCFFLLFLGEEERFPARVTLSLESSKAAGSFCFHALADFEQLQCWFWVG